MDWKDVDGMLVPHLSPLNREHITLAGDYVRQQGLDRTG